MVGRRSSGFESYVRLRTLRRDKPGQAERAVADGWLRFAGTLTLHYVRMRIAKLEGECPHEPWLLGDLNAVNRVSHPPEQALGAPRRARQAVPVISDQWAVGSLLAASLGGWDRAVAVPGSPERLLGFVWAG
jgi:hypothetical protein